ncbi:MAG: hypothetical protein V7641_3225 [Blastocatellia bacterium]
MLEGVLFGGVVGGSEGVRFDDTVSSNGRIARLTWREGSWMDAFSFEEVDRAGGLTKHHVWGRNGGTGYIIPADPKDILDDWTYLNGIYVEWGRYVDYIELYLWNRSAGRPQETLRLGKSKAHLRNRKLYFDPNAGDNREICGFAACSDDYLNAIGIYVREHRP